MSELSRTEELLEDIINDTPSTNIPLSRTEKILQGIIDGIPYEGPTESRIEKLLVQLPSGSGTLIEKSITANGTYNASDDNADGYSKITANVPNTYTNADEGKVVSNGVLLSQTAKPDTITSNNTYDTTEYNSVTVNISGSNRDITGDCNVYNNSCRSYVIDVIVPSSVTSIGDNAFHSCTGLTSIDLPDGLTSIGNNAFYSCTGLTSIDLPDGLTRIGNGAFATCTGLTSIDLPDGLTSIGDSVFNNCTGLTSIDLPDGLTSIGNSVFNNCTGLTSIDIPSSVTSIRGSAFYSCTSLTSITCRATNPPTIQVNTFSSVPVDCLIYVPADSVNIYKGATNWSVRADYIQAIPTT